MSSILTVPTDSRISVRTKEGPEFDVWKEHGLNLVRELRTTIHNLRVARTAVESEQWKFGEWILEGDRAYGEKAYDVAEKLTGWKRETLYNVVWVVRRFSSSSLRSEAILSWSHFKELARIKDDQDRERVLEKVSDGF